MSLIEQARWLLIQNTQLKAAQVEAVTNFPTLQRNMEQHQAVVARVYQAIMRPGFNPSPALVAAYGEAAQLLQKWKAADEQITGALRRAAAKAIELGKLTPAQAHSVGLGVLPAIIGSIASILTIGLILIGAVAVIGTIIVWDRNEKRLMQLRRHEFDSVLAAVQSGQLPPSALPGVTTPAGGGPLASIGFGALGIAALAAVVLLGPSLAKSLR